MKINSNKSLKIIKTAFYGTWNFKRVKEYSILFDDVWFFKKYFLYSIKYMEIYIQQSKNIYFNPNFFF